MALADAAHAVEKAWQTQNAVLIAATPTPPPKDLSVAQLPAPFQTHVDMSWRGELAPAVRVLTQQLGFAFHEVGARPVPPILISLDGIDLPLGEFLRSAGLQAGSRADVLVRDRDVSVVYKNGVAADGH